MLSNKSFKNSFKNGLGYIFTTTLCFLYSRSFDFYCVYQGFKQKNTHQPANSPKNKIKFNSLLGFPQNP